MHPRTSSCTQFLHVEDRSVSFGSWSHVSDNFLSTFNISNFEEFHDGKSLASGRGKKTSRQKGRRFKRVEDFEVMYGIFKTFDYF